MDVGVRDLLDMTKLHVSAKLIFFSPVRETLGFAGGFSDASWFNT